MSFSGLDFLRPGKLGNARLFALVMESHRRSLIPWTMVTIATAIYGIAILFIK